MKKFEGNIFVHTPKTGGSSLRRAYNSANYWSVIDHDIRDVNYKYLKEYNLDISCFCFGFVRNPWSRFVSAFNWLKLGGNCEGDKHDRLTYLGKIENFDDFVMHCNDNNKILGQLHFKPQNEWICDDHGTILLDYIGRFENFQEDFTDICKRRKIPVRKLHQTNKSQSMNYTSYYNERTINIVANMYKRDIELFNYDFR